MGAEMGFRIYGIIFFLFFVVAGYAGDLDVRHYYITNNVSYAPPRPPNQYFYAGESIKWDLYLLRGTNTLDTTNITGLVALWEISSGSVISMTATGTVTTTNGFLTFDVLPAQSALSTNVYDSRVKLYQGTSYIGDVYAAILYVLNNPATNALYIGPFNDNL